MWKRLKSALTISKMSLLVFNPPTPPHPTPHRPRASCSEPPWMRRGPPGSWRRPSTSLRGTRFKTSRWTTLSQKPDWRPPRGSVVALLASWLLLPLLHFEAPVLSHSGSFKKKTTATFSRSNLTAMFSPFAPAQKIFGDFVTVEMLFHAKALEVFTLAYQSIQNVDEEEDLEVSRSLFTALDLTASYSSCPLLIVHTLPPILRSLAAPPAGPSFRLATCFFFAYVRVFVRSLPNYFCRRPKDKTNKSAADGGGRLPFSSAPLPFHLCTFVLNHLPFIHIEVKLLTEPRLSPPLFSPVWLRWLT